MMALMPLAAMLVPHVLIQFLLSRLTSFYNRMDYLLFYAYFPSLIASSWFLLCPMTRHDQVIGLIDNLFVTFDPP